MSARMLKPDIVTPAGIQKAYPGALAFTVVYKSNKRARLHGDGQGAAEAVGKGDREDG